MKPKTTKSRWDTPQPVDILATAFGGNMQQLLPAWGEIPDEFKRHNGTPWNKVQMTWFFKGLPEETEYDVKEGIDLTKALRHLGAIQRSWEPKHEHKEAGVAYLMSLWFNEIKIPDQL